MKILVVLVMLFGLAFNKGQRWYLVAERHFQVKCQLKGLKRTISQSLLIHLLQICFIRLDLWRVSAMKGHFQSVTTRTLERWVKQLKDDNKIEFQGSKKTGGYIIK